MCTKRTDIGRRFGKLQLSLYLPRGRARLLPSQLERSLPMHFFNCRVSRCSLGLLLILLALGGRVGTTAEIYLAPDGNDQNPGTKQLPLATLLRARNVARQTKKVDEPLTIILRSGTYYLPATLGGLLHALHAAAWGDFHYRITGCIVFCLRTSPGQTSRLRSSISPAL